MIIEEKKITIRDIVENYRNHDEEGITGYRDRLDIRPKYQREFVYKDKQRDAVIDSVMKGLPLNVMYWAKIGDDLYEVLDGQQRTLSICEFYAGSFAINGRYFKNFLPDEKDTFLNYELFIYVCDGTDSEKLEWFKIINIAGERLTDQELRNAVYAGPWLTDAKKKFCKTNSPAYSMASYYLKGSPIRQDYLETILSWIAERDDISIEEYMAKNQFEKDADELWNYFEDVIKWLEGVFPDYRANMKGLPWGIYYNNYGKKIKADDKTLVENFRNQMKDLLKNEEITKKAGIYEYLLNGNEKALSLRTFNNYDKETTFAKQEGKCAICGKVCSSPSQMEADHIKPWSKGGKTVLDNCQMLCKACNIKKSNKNI